MAEQEGDHGRAAGNSRSAFAEDAGTAAGTNDTEGHVLTPPLPKGSGGSTIKPSVGDEAGVSTGVVKMHRDAGFPSVGLPRVV